MNHYDFAVQLAKDAGVRVMEMRKEEKHVTHKGLDLRDLVSNVDKEVGAFLVEEIKKTFPEHAVYSEEDGASHADTKNPYQWTIDPIDGTSNFVRDIPIFAVCIGLLHEGVPVLGAIYNPVTDELFSFEHGRGAFFGDKKIQTSSVTDLKDAYSLLRVGRNESLANWGVETQRSFLKSLKKVSNLGSSALDLAYLAAARVEVVVYGTMTTRDISVAIGMVRAAGGEVYDLSGEAITISEMPQPIVATANKALFKKLLPLLHTDLLPK